MKLIVSIFVVSLMLSSLQAETKKPNIIIILADDLGYGEVSFNGQQKIKTPNLTKMAQDGAIMTNFYAGSTVCGPSRAALMYGQHTGNLHIRCNPGFTVSGKAPLMKKDDVILPKELKRAGYKTAIFGKWGLNERLKVNVGHPLKQGFDEFVGFNTHVEAHFHWPNFYWDGDKKIDLSNGNKGANYKKRLTYIDDLFVDRCVDFIDKNSKKQFFIYLSLTIPHKGYTVPKDSKDIYKDKKWPNVKQTAKKYEMDKDIYRTYAGMITRMDSYILKVRKQLKKNNIADNTLIIFTSDNGHEFDKSFFNSGGGLRGKKRDLYEGGIRIPTVVVWPKVVKKNSKIDEILAFWDILPTFCDIAGIKPTNKGDGISFYPILKGDKKNQKSHEFLYWEFHEKTPVQAVRFGKWKALRFWNYKLKKLGKTQLYDLSNDKKEKNNIAKDNPDIVKQAERYFDTRSKHKDVRLKPKRK